MVKMAMLIVTMAAIFSFAQEGMKYGVRAGFSFCDFSLGDSDIDENIDMGYSFGAGLVISIPITNFLKFVPEVSFLYRKPMSMDLKVMEEWVTEFAISIPAMIQFSPSEGMPLYLAAGVQLDIPIASESTRKAGGHEDTEDYDGRASFDFGIPLGVGYLIMPNLGVDLRAVFGITSPDKDEKDSSFKQYGLGLTYFF